MGPKKKPDARGTPKPGTKQAKEAKAAAEKNVKQPAPEEPKKPSVKEVIGGASWTGKLPVNMLSEHCQKQKWEKPEYSMVIHFNVLIVIIDQRLMHGIATIADSIPRRLRILRDFEKSRPEDQRHDRSPSNEAASFA